MLQRLIVRACIILFLTIVALVLFQISRFYIYLKRVDYSLTPFTQHPQLPTKKILFLGDSTAVGTGSKSNQLSVAGYFAKQYPHARIDNDSRNGRKISDLLNEYAIKPNSRWDLAIVQIGGNDILRFTTLASIREDLPILLARVQSIADHVVLLHSGNVGNAPLFIWPFNNLLTQRTLAVRAIYQAAAQKAGVIYIDLYQPSKQDPLNKNIDLYYGLDYLHPSGEGYRIWFNAIRESMQQAGIQ